MSVKNINNEEYHSWRIPPKVEPLSTEPCSSYDNVPVRSRKELFLEFMANGQIAENNRRKLYFGEEYDCSDNFEYIEKYRDFQNQRIEMYRSQNKNATYDHNEQLKEEREQVKEEVKEEKNE